jgi:AcrR family transcriptional regulator
VTATAPRTARERVRAELTSEIVDVARRQLSETGAAALSLRAVARELNMASSAVYRYFPSRDDLLTRLIVDAYTAVGEAAAAADARMRRSDLAGRWMAVARAVRGWAADTPHEYALIYGSPVPGYRAPTDTIDPAARLPLLLMTIVAAAPHEEKPAARIGPLPRTVRADLAALRDAGAPGLDDRRLVRVIAAYAEVIGLISFELFGHLHNVITDYEAHFDVQLRRLTADLGLPKPRR